MKYKIHSRINRSNLSYTEHTNVGQNESNALLIYIYNWGMGEGESPPSTSQKFANSPHQKSTPAPTKQQFSSHNPIKTAFLAVVNAPAPFLF